MWGYYCPICNKTHQMRSKIGEAHYEAYLLDAAEKDRQADERRRLEPLISAEEANRRLMRAIFGEQREE